MEHQKTIQLGYKMKYLRHIIAYSQENMSELLGVERSLLSKYENGDIAPHTLLSFKIAKLFHIELEDLIDENYSVDDFAVRYTDGYFEDCPYSKRCF